MRMKKLSAVLLAAVIALGGVGVLVYGVAGTPVALATGVTEEPSAEKQTGVGSESAAETTAETGTEPAPAPASTDSLPETKPEETASGQVDQSAEALKKTPEAADEIKPTDGPVSDENAPAPLSDDEED